MHREPGCHGHPVAHSVLRTGPAQRTGLEYKDTRESEAVFCGVNDTRSLSPAASAPPAHLPHRIPSDTARVSSDTKGYLVLFISWFFAVKHPSEIVRRVIHA
jgi:hypothetical protein